MIEKIYKDITEKLISLNLKPAQEFFSEDNIPDTLLDDSFIIKPFDLENGDYSGASTDMRIFNIAVMSRIALFKKLAVNKVNEIILSNNKKVEDIIKSVLSIGVGSNEKDRIAFQSASAVVKGNSIIVELSFRFNYRITDLI